MNLKVNLILILVLSVTVFAAVTYDDIEPSATNTWSLGTSTYEFKDAFGDGTLTWDTITDGTYTNTMWNDAYDKRVDTWTAPLVWSSNVASIPVATTSVDGYLSSTDWTTFNSKVTAVFYTWHFDLAADIMPAFDIRGDETDYWEVNSSDYSEMYPVTGTGTSAGWELDGNDNLMPVG